MMASQLTAKARIKTRTINTMRIMAIIFVEELRALISIAGPA